MRTAIAVGLALALVACSSDGTGPENGGTTYSVTGSWEGVVGSTSFRMTLVDQNGTVTGSGTLTTTEPRAITIDGVRDVIDVSLTISSEGFQDANYDAQVRPDRVTMFGSLHGSGFNMTPLELRRQ